MTLRAIIDLDVFLLWVSLFKIVAKTFHYKDENIQTTDIATPIEQKYIVIAQLVDNKDVVNNNISILIYHDTQSECKLRSLPSVGGPTENSSKYLSTPYTIPYNGVNTMAIYIITQKRRKRLP